ncbi:transmembrane protein 234 homolog [Anoplophora glabripennis]|uniref:transmembrane protein 234 homolog n=1 Tax=Anoplophora glabripennis TaxID=217634 RepID=UPI000873EE14|nr:transmembrane protein 234 homolog [Anoplophora glabripennis]
MLKEGLSLMFVALLWGGTNPLIKKNSKEILNVKADSRILQFILELKYLATNVRYLIPMALNQLGSVLYFLTLKNVDLTLSVPVANSLTFVFTALSGWILGEQLPRKNAIFGILLILVGTVLCCIDKYVNKVD